MTGLAKELSDREIVRQIVRCRNTVGAEIRRNGGRGNDSAARALKPHLNCQAMAAGLPLLSITTDNGKEFAEHATIAQTLGCDFYDAEPEIPSPTRHQLPTARAPASKSHLDFADNTSYRMGSRANQQPPPHLPQLPNT